MRYGMIGTCYNAGISHIASGFAEHLDMKTLLVHNKPFATFPERFPNHRITTTMDQADIDWLLTDIDLLFTIETPYNWDVYRQAKAKGIKTVLMPMIEWLDRTRPELNKVDLFVCPSTYTYELMNRSFPENKLALVPCEVPISSEKFKPRAITQFHTFLHNSGHGGIGGRNSTQELLEAIPLVQRSAKFIIRSQFPIANKVDDPRITYLEGNVENYWDLYDEGDVWIMPWKYGVAALGLQESMAAGMVPVITDMDPFTGFMPKELLIKPETLTRKRIYARQDELYATQSPKLIARKIEDLYDMPSHIVRPLVGWANNKAHEWSWDTWESKYKEIFELI